MSDRAAGAEGIDLRDGGTSVFQRGFRPPEQQLDQGNVGHRILFVEQVSSLATHGRMPLCADERLLEAAEPRVPPAAGALQHRSLPHRPVGTFQPCRLGHGLFHFQGRGKANLQGSAQKGVVAPAVVA